jgi:hypothetical protein
MHELPYNPTDYGSSELFPCRQTVKHRSHSLQRKACICELAGSAVWLRSLRRTLLLWRSRHSYVRALFQRSSSLACAHRPYRNQLPSETTAYVAAVTPLLDNGEGEHAAVDGRRALPWREAPLFVERAGAP